MKKVTIFGGGTGMSTLLKGLKEFPLDITSVVSVCDDGKSTGKLRKEFNIPAMGDIRRVMISLSETEPLMEKLLNYRFSSNSELNEHTVGNLLLTAGTQITGNLSDGIKSISKVLNLKGKVIPFSEDNIVLSAIMEDGMGSLYTSIIPNLLSKKIIEKLDKTSAKIMYVCNMVTQPGETDDFKVSDHLKVLNSYLGTHKIDIVVANTGSIDKEVAEKYSTLEQKDPVLFDEENIDCDTILNNYVTINDGVIRHNVEKLSLDIYSYLVNE